MKKNNTDNKNNNIQNANETINILHYKTNQSGKYQFDHKNYENEKKINDENTTFINTQKNELKKQLKYQDDALDELEKGIERLHQIGISIKDESALQKVMLENLDNDISNDNNKIATINNKIKKFLNVSDNCNMLWIIIILCIILFISICLIIWT